jgi:hypothetical protein
VRRALIIPSAAACRSREDFGHTHALGNFTLRNRRRKAAVIGAMLVGAWLAGPVPVLEGAAESIESLKDFTGVWAHSEADCKEALSGRLDHVDRVTS